jgi:hypothetical protein
MHVRLNIKAIISFIIILTLFSFFPQVYAIAETRYLRSDTHTVNGLTARKLGTDLTGSVTTEIYRTAVTKASADFGVRFFRRLANGSEIEIISSGTPIIIGTRTAVGSGLQSVNISVSEIALNPTDAIIVRCYYRNPATTGTWTQTGWTTPNWITPQLGASKLDAATWTVYLYTIITPSESLGKYDIGLGFGSTSKNSRIEGFTWTYAPARTWHDIASLSFTLQTRKWYDVDFLNFQFITRIWHYIESLTLNLITETLKVWHDIAILTFTIETIIKKAFSFIILIGGIIILAISIFILLKR